MEIDPFSDGARFLQRGLDGKLLGRESAIWSRPLPADDWSGRMYVCRSLCAFCRGANAREQDSTGQCHLLQLCSDLLPDGTCHALGLDSQPDAGVQVEDRVQHIIFRPQLNEGDEGVSIGAAG